MATRKHKRKIQRLRHLEQKRLKGKGQPRSKKINKKNKPWVPVKMKMFNIPNIFPSELSMEKRMEIIRSIGINAKEDFNNKYPELQKWFKDYDPLYILSFCAFYFTSQPEGIDLEATGEMDFFHHYLEILQALSLYEKRNFSAKPLLDEAENLRAEVIKVGELMQIRLLDIPQELNTEEELHSYRLRTEMMAHTTAVRNWAYFHQMKRVVFDLSRLVKSDFEKIYGIDPVIFFEILLKLTEERNDLLNEHRFRIRNCIKKQDYKEIIKTYNDTFPDMEKIEGEEIEMMWNAAGKKVRNLSSMLICHSDLRLKDIYSFNIQHVSELSKSSLDIDIFKSMFSQLSLNFGELKDFNRDHIILSNPVLSKPFIKLDENNFYSAIWGIMPHLALDILEDFVWKNESLRINYSKLKSTYLEDQIEILFKNNFPNALIYRGSIWHDPKTNKDYENDLIVLVDSFAVIIEAKSGSITDPAKRGAPERLFKTLKELIEEPSEQSLRFIEFLQNNKKEHIFNTKRKIINKIDNTKIKYYIPIGVTLSHLGAIGSNLKKLIDAKIVNKKLEELAPSINLTDLESIFDLLPLESEKIHYLARRREFEAHVVYEGDELDLLGFYLDNGFNIGEDEYSQNLAMNISLKSKELDPYFVGSNEGVSVEKPKLSMTEWWRDLLNVISSRRTEGWIETSFILLNSTQGDQEKFEKAFRKLVGRVEKGKLEKPHNWVLFTTGPERRRYAIAGYPYTTTDKEIRNGVMNSIIDDEHTGKTRGIIIIGVSLKNKDYPYSVLARRLATDLFDTLTLPPKD